MFSQLARLAMRSSLVQRFTAVSFVILICGMLGIGWWVGNEIKSGVINESAVTAALYMDSFIAPNLQELSNTNTLTQEHITVLDDTLRETDLGSRIVAFKVWDRQSNVVYSKGPTLFSDVFPNTADQARVWDGQVVAEINESQAEKKLEQQKFGSQLLQIYSPVRRSGTDKVIAIAEFYVKVDSLEGEIAAAQRNSWMVVGALMLAVYLLLVGFVKWAGDTIRRQETLLTRQVTQLKDLLAQNDELRRRVQRAAANTTARNERFLRRISAELHDGPVQDLGLALLRLDCVMGQNESCRYSSAGSVCHEHLPIIQSALQHALEEMRTIAAGLGLPQLEGLTLSDVLSRVVRSHERRTGSQVVMSLGELPQETTLPIKITAYRLIQEALTNAFRHTGGAGQQVRVTREAENLCIEISDRGPGFDAAAALASDEHLGLAGMSERVESLGGLFRIVSEAGKGTRIIAQLSMNSAEGSADG